MIIVEGVKEGGKILSLTGGHGCPLVLALVLALVLVPTLVPVEIHADPESK
jgi:hypothetical protein